MAKKLYPGKYQAYQTILFDKLTRNQCQYHRIKMDQSIKKIITYQTIQALNNYQNQLQLLFEIYMPQNYNKKLQFGWKQLRLLEKKLPIICVLRLLTEAQVIPYEITALHYFEIVNKMLPPLHSNHKQVMFYNSQTINMYMRQRIMNEQIKLLQGDIGVTFFQFQILILKISIDLKKDNSKNDYVQALKKLFDILDLKNLGRNKNKLQRNIENYKFNRNNKQQLLSNNKQQLLNKKNKTKGEELLDRKDKDYNEEQYNKNQFKLQIIGTQQLERIKKYYEQQLPEFPIPKYKYKQNENIFNTDQKYIVIGEQLPLIQQKNNKISIKDTNTNNNNNLLCRYKPQLQKKQQICTNLLKRIKKIRLNNQLPAILSEVFYPNQLTNLEFNCQANVYLQTTYIQLDQKLCHQAYLNSQKAKQISSSSSNILQDYYFKILQAQVYQAARKDQMALILYDQARGMLNINEEISCHFSGMELLYAKLYPYLGLASCFYHLQEYAYALRGFYKVMTVSGNLFDKSSVENALLHNNIGCCLMMLDRNKEASYYLQVSHRIYDLKVGRMNERSLLVEQNISKNKKAYLEMMPEFRTMWKTYEQKVKGKNKIILKNKEKKNKK